MPYKDATPNDTPNYIHSRLYVACLEMEFSKTQSDFAAFFLHLRRCHTHRGH